MIDSLGRESLGTPLTAQQENQIKKYYVLSRLIMPCLIMSFVVLGLCVLLQMIGDIALDAKNSWATGLPVCLVIVFCLMALYCYAMISVNVATKGKNWADILSKLGEQAQRAAADGSMPSASGVLGAAAAGRLMSNSNDETVSGMGEAAEFASAIGAVALAEGQSGAIRKRVDPVARAAGLKVSAKGWVLAVVIVPLVALSSCYGMLYAQAVPEKHQQVAAVSQAQQQIAGAFESTSYSISSANPNSTMHTTYYITCRGSQPDNRYVSIDLDMEGRIVSLTYCADTSASATQQDRIAAFNEAVGQMAAILKSSGVPAADAGLLERTAVPTELSTPLLSCPSNTDFHQSMRLDSENISLSCEVEGRTETDPPYLYFTIYPA